VSLYVEVSNALVVSLHMKILDALRCQMWHVQSMIDIGVEGSTIVWTSQDFEGGQLSTACAPDVPLAHTLSVGKPIAWPAGRLALYMTMFPLGCTSTWFGGSTAPWR